MLYGTLEWKIIQKKEGKKEKNFNLPEVYKDLFLYPLDGRRIPLIELSSIEKEKNFKPFYMTI